MSTPRHFKRRLKDPREVLGYRGGDLDKPIYAVRPGSIVTQAMIICSQCMRVVRTNGGIMSDAWCVPCTEEKAGVQNDR